MLDTPEGRLRILKALPLDFIRQMPRSSPADLGVWILKIDRVARLCDPTREDGTIAYATELRQRIRQWQMKGCNP